MERIEYALQVQAKGCWKSIYRDYDLKATRRRYARYVETNPDARCRIINASTEDVIVDNQIESGM